MENNSLSWNRVSARLVVHQIEEEDDEDDEAIEVNANEEEDDSSEMNVVT